MPSNSFGVSSSANSHRVGNTSINSVGESTLIILFTLGSLINSGDLVDCSKFVCLVHWL